MTAEPQQTVVANSTLAYVFADQLLPAQPPGAKGQRCWSTGTTVDAEALARRLGAVAVLGLRDAGMVHLQAYETRKLMVKVRGVRARLVGTPALTGGVEHALLTRLAGRATKDAEGSDVGDVFYGFVPESRAPWNALVGLAVDDAALHGLLLKVAPEGNRLGRALRGRPSYDLQPVPAAIEAAREAASDVIARWQRGQQHDSQLVEALERTIGKALRRRVETAD